MNGNGKQTRRLLLIGFGCLLALLAISGLYTLSVIGKIQAEDKQIRNRYVSRDRILDQLRSDIYVSGTYVRDFLIDPDPSHAATHRTEFEAARQRVQSAIPVYRRFLEGEEKVSFDHFTTELAAYFDSLQPALQWDMKQRQRLGYAFVTTSMLPRRATIVHLADQISGFNRKQMEISNSQVQELFGNFRRSLIVLLAFTCLSGFIVAGASVRRILHLEKLSHERLREALEARQASQHLSARLLEVQEEERRALSRELHDEIGQSLSALLVGLGNLSASLFPACAEAAGEQLTGVRKLAERTVATVRDMSLLLRPSMLDDLGLLPALEWQAREVSRTKDLPVEVHAESVSEDLPDEHKTCVFRIVQEALHNVVRHSRAKHVQISLCESPDNLRLTIKDDGRGFVPEREKGLGLLGMRERVEHLSGTFQVQSQPGQGTVLAVDLPLTR